jgi:hypothetical protein
MASLEVISMTYVISPPPRSEAGESRISSSAVGELRRGNWKAEKKPEERGQDEDEDVIYTGFSRKIVAH